IQKWSTHYQVSWNGRVQLRPHTAGTDLLELRVLSGTGDTMAMVIFSVLHDRRGQTILLVRDQLTAPALRQKRLMTLVQLFLIHRYGAVAVNYLTPSDDNHAQATKMVNLGIFARISAD